MVFTLGTQTVKNQRVQMIILILYLLVHFQYKPIPKEKTIPELVFEYGNGLFFLFFQEGSLLADQKWASGESAFFIHANKEIKMIIGNAEHLSAYKAQLSEELYDCLEKMAAYGFEDLPDGKYEINGYKVGVETSMTEPADKRKLEGHQRYIDIVYEVDVEEEQIGCRSVWEAGKVTESYEDRDLYFFASEGEESRAYLHTGNFVICFPEDLHRPLCMGAKGPCRIKKAVLKFPLNKL